MYLHLFIRLIWKEESIGLLSSLAFTFRMHFEAKAFIVDHYVPCIVENLVLLFSLFLAFTLCVDVFLFFWS